MLQIRYVSTLKDLDHKVGTDDLPEVCPNLVFALLSAYECEVW